MDLNFAGVFCLNFGGKLRNRRFFNQQYEYEWRRCQRGNHPLSVILIDIDHFKEINDTYGHSTGDQVLQTCANIIQGCVRRATDFVCRYGGEEFIIILAETKQESALKIAEKIRTEIAKSPIIAGNYNVTITISAGISMLTPKPTKNTKVLIDFADKALYKAKNEGRNKVIAYS